MSDTPWLHFTNAELTCHCGCGRMEMDVGFMAMLEDLRIAFGKPLPVTSGYRCPEHNAAISVTGLNGPHASGAAVDVLVSGQDAYDLIALAKAAGMTGVGIKQHGSHHTRFIHLDALPRATNQPRPTIWSYPK
ncbi:D-Ala-D-Ala carboxypeptidase family metallohydrolase [Magnetofaba australis]|nr:D-Ala-D-Ala carboxypeptidase family metallohydrolase [Magnetofaba australis]